MFLPKILFTPKILMRSSLATFFCLAINFLFSTPTTHAEELISADKSKISFSWADAQKSLMTLNLHLQAGAIKELETFYLQRNFTQAWSATNLPQLISEIQLLSSDGLTPSEYSLAQLETILSQKQFTLSNDLLASHAYLKALHHLFAGKVDPATFDTTWNYTKQSLNSAAFSAEIATAMERNSLTTLFAKARPNHVFYQNLQAGLKRQKAIADSNPWPLIPSGPTLKPCTKHPNVAALRKRLSSSSDYPAQNSSQAASEFKCPQPLTDDDFYDADLRNAVSKFQAENYLSADGAVGPGTRAALNISAQARVDQIRVNLDRARWLLHDIPSEMVLVDIAGFSLTYYKNNQPAWRSKVQVGTPFRETPIFKSSIDHITLNPTWTIPPTILRKDVLPKLRKNLSYLAKNNVQVYDAKGRKLNPAQVNWNNPGNVTLRQDAGEDAALGQAVIRFPNNYAIFLHDTPHKSHFADPQRAFSSGCIRVENILELLPLILSDDTVQNKDKVANILKTGKTTNVNLARNIPIFLAYWTVEAKDATKLIFKPDTYARDAKVLVALNRP